MLKFNCRIYNRLKFSHCSGEAGRIRQPSEKPARIGFGTGYRCRRPVQPQQQRGRLPRSSREPGSSTANRRLLQKPGRRKPKRQTEQRATNGLYTGTRHTGGSHRRSGRQ